MDCYKNFAHIYDELIKEDVNYEKWCNFILELCDEHKIERENYLDLACGTANMTELVCQYFKNTWAVDMSEEMLSEAEEKLRTKGKKGKFVCQDISNLCLNRKFNLITCCLDSTNYIIEDKDINSYFERVYNHLDEDGIFIFDINSYYKLSTVLGNNTYTYDEDDIFYVWENSFEDNIVDMYLTFFIKKNNLYERFDEFHSERAYKKEEIEDIILNNNFKIVNIFDNYRQKSLCETTERIVYVLKK